MILDIILPSSFMVQGALMMAAALLLILKFRDNKDYRGR